MANVTNLQEAQQRQLKIGIIVQARMTSKRFPGKSTALLKDKPVIQWVLERAKLIKGPKNLRHSIKVILAVPDDPLSDPMLDISDNMGIESFLGSELDVLKRYYDCARLFKLDIIVRITADCPFIDPIVSSEVLNLLLWRRLDYCSNSFPKRTYPKGLDTEAFTFDALEAAYQLGRLPEDREHVTPWLTRTEDIKRGNVCQKIDTSEKNWCVDFPEDIKRLENEITLGNIVNYINVKTH